MWFMLRTVYVDADGEEGNGQRPCEEDSRSLR